MDDPELPSHDHVQALAGLRRLNIVSATTRSIWRPIRRATAGQTTPLRILDLACGGGDLVLDLARRARAAGIDADVHGADLSPRALDTARAKAERSGERVTFFQLDALDDAWPDDFDVIASNLFLHHLADDDLPVVLERAAQATRRLLVFCDLKRSRSGWLLARAATQLLSRSPVVHHDGPQSIRAAWTAEELDSAARQARLDGAVVEPIWPERLRLVWERPA